MSILGSPKAGSDFDRALCTIDSLALDEQEALLEVVRRRISSARRAGLAREIAAARSDHRHGKVRRGTAAELISELRGA